MCTIPGGVTDAPIIAADMGADTFPVAIVQLARYILGVGIFPPMILAFDNMRRKTEARKAASAGTDGYGVTNDVTSQTAARKKSTIHSPQAFFCTTAIALLAGFLGGLTHIPAGIFLFSTAAVLVLKLKFDLAYIPHWMQKCALLISGCYIGSAITMDEVLGFKLLALPLAITLGWYIANCFVTGKILSKTCGFNRKESMLATTPAGASDIALSSADMGVENTDVIIIQVFRSVMAMALFPQIINVLTLFFPG
jgi:membrane AbrB-like protein